LRHISPDLHLPSIHDYIQEPQHLVFDWQLEKCTISSFSWRWFLMIPKIEI
jgi:hypothetical protein